MEIFLTRQQIQNHIVLAAQIINEYEKKPEVILGTLSGSVLFFSDLIRNLTFDFEIDFIKPHKYYTIGPIGGTIIYGKRVLVIEDVIDTGKTIERIVKDLQYSEPSSIEFCSLLKRRGYELPQYLIDQGVRLGYCEEINKGWAVGFGMDDFQGRKRNLPNVYITNE